jgi:uroporphyrinogen decarboxylase
MRQAGRYLPEYRLLRARHDFVELCKTPELACEITLLPWQRFGMDAVILFSDILFIPESLGQKLIFKKEEGPDLSPIIKDPAQINSLKMPDAKEYFDFVYQTIKVIKKKIPADLPLIGFSGAPWTLAHYMTGELSKTWMTKNPQALHRLLDILTEVIITYLREQQIAGADVIQIFDTWGGDLSAVDYKIFVLPYLKKIIGNARKTAPFIIYTRKCRHILELLPETGADVISIDPETPMEEAIDKIGNDVAIQGNIDPKLLLTTPGLVKQETSRLLSKIGKRNGHIINLGHGVLQTTPLECVEAFVETVKHSSV